MALGVGDGPGYIGVGDGNGAAGIGGSGKCFACRPSISISSADIAISFFSTTGKDEITLGSLRTLTDPEFGNETGL